MATRAPQQERSRRTVDRILTAADRLISQHGSTVTTTAIAEAAGVSVGALYRFFPDKHAIGRALAEQYLEVATVRFGAIIEVIETLDDVPAALREIIEVAAELALEHPGYYRLTNERRPDEEGSVGYAVRVAMVDTFDAVLVSLGSTHDASRRRAAVTMAIETVRHTLAIAPRSEPDRTMVISELAEMVVLYADRRLAR